MFPLSFGTSIPASALLIVLGQGACSDGADPFLEAGLEGAVYPTIVRFVRGFSSLPVDGFFPGLPSQEFCEIFPKAPSSLLWFTFPPAAPVWVRAGLLWLKP